MLRSSHTLWRGVIIDVYKLIAKDGTIEQPLAGLPADKMAALRNAKGLVIGEIAGRDSIAALRAVCESEPSVKILPTAVYTGTEYGDWGVINTNLGVLREALRNECTIFDLIVFGNPALWAALNGRYETVLYRRYGMFSPCLACHLYMHLSRVPLSFALGSVPIVSGERDHHGGCVKLSQTTATINALRDVLAYAGITLLLPVRHIDSNAEIEAMVGDGWKQGQRQLICVLSGNYKDIDGAVTYDNAALQRYLEEFLIPCGRAIIDAWHANGIGERTDAVKIDYEAIVEKVVTS